MTTNFAVVSSGRRARRRRRRRLAVGLRHRRRRPPLLFGGTEAATRSTSSGLAHVVHHHSEDYNLAVALRQAWSTSMTALPLFLLLGLLDLPPHIYLVSKAVNTLYQFWIHTELTDRLGPIELVLNTPSHHRVHQAVNDEHLDRNYGGILILFGLFGTFEPEEAPPVYGTTKLVLK